jgi:glycosyltransferase involved in cell wall biosynthesis
MNSSAQLKKKIMLVVTKSTWGGAQRYVYDIATHLQKDEYEVTVLCGSGGELVTQLQGQSIRVIELEHLARDIHLIDEFKVLFQLKKIFEAELPDVIHLNSSKIGGLGALAGRLAGVPKIIYTAHGWAFNEKRGLLWRTLTSFASWLTMILCHRIITISTREQQQAISFPFINADKVGMIYIGIPFQNYLPENEARHLILERTNHETRLRTLWVGSLGELHANKGHIDALESVRLIHESGVDIFYCIIGEGELREELEHFIQKNGMRSYCVLPGAIPTDTSGATLLKAFDVFLFPSLKEGLPFAILEALQAGTPVVASSVGGIPEIIESKVHGLLVPPQNMNEIRMAMEYVLFDERIQKDFATAGERRVQERFTIEAMLHETVFEYEN